MTNELIDLYWINEACNYKLVDAAIAFSQYLDENNLTGKIKITKPSIANSNMPKTICGIDIKWVNRDD